MLDPPCVIGYYLIFVCHNDNICQITNSTVHIKETFSALRDEFLGIIDYLDETLRSITPQTRRRQKRQIKPFKTQVREDERQHIVKMMDILGELGSKISSTIKIPNSFQEYLPQYLKVDVGSLRVES